MPMSGKSLSISVLAAVTVLLATFSAIAMRATPEHAPITAAAAVASLRQPASAQTGGGQPSSAQPASQPASAQAARTAPAGAALHTVAKGESLPGLVHRYLPLTHFMTGSELEEAIRVANPGVKGISPTGIWPKPGSELVIPSYQESWTERPVPAAKSFEVRAI